MLEITKICYNNTSKTNKLENIRKFLDYLVISAHKKIKKIKIDQRTVFKAAVQNKKKLTFLNVLNILFDILDCIINYKTLSKLRYSNIIGPVKEKESEYFNCKMNLEIFYIKMCILCNYNWSQVFSFNTCIKKRYLERIFWLLRINDRNYLPFFCSEMFLFDKNCYRYLVKHSI